MINAALSPGISLKHGEKGWTIAPSKSMSNTDWTTTLNHLSNVVDHSTLNTEDANKLDKIAANIKNGLEARQSGFFAKIKDWILTRTSTKYVEENKALEEAHTNFKKSVSDAKESNSGLSLEHSSTIEKLEFLKNHVPDLPTARQMLHQPGVYLSNDQLELIKTVLKKNGYEPNDIDWPALVLRQESLSKDTKIQNIDLATLIKNDGKVSEKKREKSLFTK